MNKQNYLRATLPSFLIILFSIGLNAQSKGQQVEVSESLRASAAFAEIALKRTELESEIEALLLDYKDDFPKLMALRHEMNVLDKSTAMLSRLDASQGSRLTSALGKLVVRRSELETALWTVSARYGSGHPEVKRAGRRVEIFDAAIKELLK